MTVTKFKKIIAQVSIDINNMIFVDSNTDLEYDYDDICGNEQIFGEREIDFIGSRILVNDACNKQYRATSQIVIYLI